MASIRTEISQCLPSLLSRLDKADDVSIRYSRIPCQKKQYSHHKECPLCVAAKRKSCNHYLSDCKFLPEQDKKYITGMRRQSKTQNSTIEESLSEFEDSEEEEDDADCTHAKQMPIRPSAARRVVLEKPVSEPEQSHDEYIHETDDCVEDEDDADERKTHARYSAAQAPVNQSAPRKADIRKSPQFKAVYRQHPLTVTLALGAGIEMVKATLAQALGVKIRKTTHTANQDDGTTPLNIVGKTTFSISQRGIDVTLKALVVSNLDVDILAGIPFMMMNDIAVFKFPSHFPAEEPN